MNVHAPRCFAITLAAIALVGMGGAAALVPPVAEGPVLNGGFTLGVPLAPVGGLPTMSHPTAAAGWSFITNGYTQAPQSTSTLVEDGEEVDLEMRVDIAAADASDYYIALGQSFTGGKWTLVAPGTVELYWSIRVPEGEPALFTQAVVFMDGYQHYANVNGRTITSADGWHVVRDVYRVLPEGTQGDPGNADWLVQGQSFTALYIALYPEGNDGGAILIDDVAIVSPDGAIAFG